MVALVYNVVFDFVTMSQVLLSNIYGTYPTPNPINYRYSLLVASPIHLSMHYIIYIKDNEEENNNNNNNKSTQLIPTLVVDTLFKIYLEAIY